MNMIMKTVALGAVFALTGTIAAAQDRDLAQEEANRRLVVDFYERFHNEHDLTAAGVISRDYIHHNSYVPGGKEAFLAFFKMRFAENPEAKSRIVQSAADGDLVWLHVHSTNDADDPGRAIVDIFRVEDGNLVEHWDVIQPVRANPVTGNSMF